MRIATHVPMMMMMLMLDHCGGKLEINSSRCMKRDARPI